MMGHMPLAGVVWQVLHYLEGFRRLGFEIYYIEDTCAWPYDPTQDTITENCSYSVNYVGQLMAQYGWSNRWAYRTKVGGVRVFGLSETAFSNLFQQADILVNLTGSTRLRAEHLRVPLRIYLETDPVLPQIEVAHENAARIAALDSHTHHFSYGENLGAPDCGVPVVRYRYRPTRQPVVLDWWSSTSRVNTAFAGSFTTIASWRQSDKDIRWNDEIYSWSKHHEFLKLIDLPQRTSTRLQLALALRSNKSDSANQWISLHPDDWEAIQQLRSHGWEVVNGINISKKILPYRNYVWSSLGEFTVAKDQNVRLRSGWFSDRSACYLAASRPVITQDTAFGKFLPIGEGLFAFKTMNDVLSAFELIHSDYSKHCRAARAIAEEYFRAETVLAKLVDDLGL